MKGEWISRLWKGGKAVNPKDNATYIVHPAVVEFTVKILREYGARIPAAEGLVYWSGIVKGDKYMVISAVAPKVQASRHAINTTHNANATFVEYIREHKLQYISQVHSHPGDWVEHSCVDDNEAAFRSEGLVSIVAPRYGNKAMMPLTICGIHRYTKGKFIRLGKAYVKKHFIIDSADSIGVFIKDFRNG